MQQSRFIAASIVSVVDDYNFTVNVDTTGFTAFTYPTVAQQPSSFPEVTPVGEDTALSLLTLASQLLLLAVSKYSILILDYLQIQLSIQHSWA